MPSFVGTGNEDAAAMGGKAAVEAAKAAGWDKVQGCRTNFRRTGRRHRYGSSVRLCEGVAEAGGERFLKGEIQYADAVADKAANRMEAVMQNHPEGIAIIVCNNDDMAMAAARAAKGNGSLREDHLRWLRRHRVRMQSHPGWRGDHVRCSGSFGTTWATRLLRLL
ncbi:MAG: hypothetical protein ACLR4Z_10065 [Butyricicoccaceae bacterium]